MNWIPDGHIMQFHRSGYDVTSAQTFSFELWDIQDPSP